MMSVKKIRGKVPTFQSDGGVTIIKHWCEEKSHVPAQLVLSVCTNISLIFDLSFLQFLVS